ncbi:ribonuclease H-like domain-containing protein, partial [Tanacetum coccineum]
MKHHQGEQEKKDAHGLLNNFIEETASKLAESRKSKLKALVGAFETVISLSKTANPLPRNEESSIAPLVVKSSHASSDKEESLIAPPVSESTQDEGVLEDESEYTDDHNEEVEVSEDESESIDNEKEVAAAQNDEMDTPSEETPRVKSAIPNYLRASTGSCHDIYNTQDEGVLEDESEYTDDHNEEVEVSEDESKSTNNEKEVAAAQNDEMDTPSEETPRVKSAIPNYLTASTSSCNDICKYGKRHEHVSEETPRVKSAILPS